MSGKGGAPADTEFHTHCTGAARLTVSEERQQCRCSTWGERRCILYNVQRDLSELSEYDPSKNWLSENLLIENDSQWGKATMPVLTSRRNEMYTVQCAKRFEWIWSQPKLAERKLTDWKRPSVLERRQCRCSTWGDRRCTMCEWAKWKWSPNWRRAAANFILRRNQTTLSSLYWEI